MQNDVWRMVVYLTTTRFNRETLNEKTLKALVTKLRSDPSQYPTFYSFLEKRAKSTSSQTRFLTLHLANYFFTRSAHFRSVVCHSYLYGFLVNFYKDLPDPYEFAKKIDMTFPVVIDIWCNDYKNIYPQLAHLQKYFPPKEEELTTIQKQQKTNAALLLRNYKRAYDPLLTEMKNLANLLNPPDADKYPPTDEYKEIVIQAIKEHKKEMERCVNDIDWLNSITKRTQKGTQLGNEIEEFTKQAKELNDLITMYDDEEFEDVEFDEE